MKKRILYFMMALYLCSFNVAEVHAEAGLLTVLGGSIATGGLTGEALVAAVSPYMVPVLLGVLVASGMNVYLTEQSQQAGMTKSEYLKDKVRSYCDAAGKPIDQFWGNFAEGCTVLQNGSITLGNQAQTQVKQFINYLQSQDDIFDKSTAISGQVVKYGDLVIPISDKWDTTGLASGTYQNISVGRSSALVRLGQTTNYCVFSIGKNYGISVKTYTNGVYTSGSSGAITSFGNGYRYTTFTVSAEYGYIDCPVVNFNNPTDFLNSLDGSFTPEVASSDPTKNTVIDLTGNGVNNANDALSPSSGDTPVLNPGLTSGIDLTGLSGLTTTIEEYLDALRDVLDGIQNPSISGEREDTGEKVREDIDTPAVTDPSIDDVPDQDIPNIKTPVIDKTKQPTGNNAVRPLTMDLKTVFPFCLPFDAYNMLNKLNAEPVAPNYHVDWYIPLVNSHIVFDVNLSAFDDTAAILRNIELLAFCVGLAIITRNIIRG